MSSYVTLLGAEDVSRAGHQMREAAEQMRSASYNIDATMTQHSRNMDDWLNRFEALVTRLEALNNQRRRRGMDQ